MLGLNSLSFLSIAYYVSLVHCRAPVLEQRARCCTDTAVYEMRQQVAADRRGSVGKVCRSLCYLTLPRNSILSLACCRGWMAVLF